MAGSPPPEESRIVVSGKTLTRVSLKDAATQAENETTVPPFPDLEHEMREIAEKALQEEANLSPRTVHLVAGMQAAQAARTAAYISPYASPAASPAAPADSPAIVQTDGPAVESTVTQTAAGAETTTSVIIATDKPLDILASTTADISIHIGPHTTIPCTASPGLQFLKSFLAALAQTPPSENLRFLLTNAVDQDKGGGQRHIRYEGFWHKGDEKIADGERPERNIIELQPDDGGGIIGVLCSETRGGGWFLRIPQQIDMGRDETNGRIRLGNGYSANSF